MGDHLVAAAVGSTHELRPVLTGQPIDRHADFQVVLVANIEQPSHADFSPEFTKRFSGVITLAKRVRRERRLQRTAPRWFISVPRLEGNAQHESDPRVVGPLERLLSHFRIPPNLQTVDLY